MYDFVYGCNNQIKQMTYRIRNIFFLMFKEEYQLCYGAVAEYLQNDSVYANA